MNVIGEPRAIIPEVIYDRLRSREVPVSFKRWQVPTEVRDEFQPGDVYYLEPNDTIRRAVRDGDTWH